MDFIAKCGCKVVGIKIPTISLKCKNYIGEFTMSSLDSYSDNYSDKWLTEWKKLNNLGG